MQAMRSQSRPVNRATPPKKPTAVWVCPLGKLWQYRKQKEEKGE